MSGNFVANLGLPTGRLCSRALPPVQPSLPRTYRRRTRGARWTSTPCSSSNEERGSETEGSAEEAFAVAERCLELFRSQGGPDAIVELLPDSVIDRCLFLKRDKEQRDGTGTGAADITFAELLELAQPADLALDAYAMRMLVLAPPAAVAPLSYLKPSPECFLARYAATGGSGEAAVLTLVLKLEESLEPRYRGLQVVKRWFLHAITGEPADPGELPAEPGPCWGPESVVLAQLQALRDEDVGAVFRHASPANAAVTGPSPERFGALLRGPAYRPLLGHARSELLQSVALKRDRALVIVGVTPNLDATGGLGGPSGKVVYVWSLSLQAPPQPQAGLHQPVEPLAGGGLGDHPGGLCWMVDAVQPVTGSTGLFGAL